MNACFNLCPSEKSEAGGLVPLSSFVVRTYQTAKTCYCICQYKEEEDETRYCQGSVDQTLSYSMGFMGNFAESIDCKCKRR